MKRLLVLGAVGAALAALPGCAEPDGRVADMAQQVTHEQAQQNQRIAEGSKAVAEGSQQLVEHDAKARRELVGLQQDLRKDQAEIDRYWDKLLEGGKPMACGWLTDRFGLCWQIVPEKIGEMLKHPKAMAAMMNMVKFDIATLEAAAKE